MEPRGRPVSYFRRHEGTISERAAELHRERQVAAEELNQAYIEGRIAKINKMPIIEERGVEEDILEEAPHYKEQIENRGWQQLVALPKVGNKTITRHFYVAGSPPDFKTKGEVELFGKKIAMGPAEINAKLQIPEVPDCPSGWSVEVDEIEIQDIFQSLHKDGEPCHTLQVTHATPDAAFWHLFVAAAITPVGKHQKFSDQRARLCYAIIKGEPVNVGQLIFNSIAEAMEGKQSRSLVFPSLITDFCRDAGIDCQGSYLEMTIPRFIKVQAVNNQRGRKAAPKIQTAKARAKARSSGAETSSSCEGDSSSAEGDQPVRPVSVSPIRGQAAFAAAMHAHMAATNRLAELNRMLAAAFVSERADKDAEIQRLLAEIERLQTELAAAQRMCGTTYQRAGRRQPPPADQ